VRSGEQVAKDMIAVRIGPDMRIAVVNHHLLSNFNGLTPSVEWLINLSKRRNVSCARFAIAGVGLLTLDASRQRLLFSQAIGSGR
jgi:hypothetical protein